MKALILISPANGMLPNVNSMQRSFMKITNSGGPKFDAGGTPEVVMSINDSKP